MSVFVWLTVNWNPWCFWITLNSGLKTKTHKFQFWASLQLWYLQTTKISNSSMESGGPEPRPFFGTGACCLWIMVIRHVLEIGWSHCTRREKYLRCASQRAEHLVHTCARQFLSPRNRAMSCENIYPDISLRFHHTYTKPKDKRFHKCIHMWEQLCYFARKFFYSHNKAEGYFHDSCVARTWTSKLTTKNSLGTSNAANLQQAPFAIVGSSWRGQSRTATPWTSPSTQPLSRMSNYKLLTPSAAATRPLAKVPDCPWQGNSAKHLACVCCLAKTLAKIHHLEFPNWKFLCKKKKYGAKIPLHSEYIYVHATLAPTRKSTIQWHSPSQRWSHHFASSKFACALSSFCIVGEKRPLTVCPEETQRGKVFAFVTLSVFLHKVTHKEIHRDSLGPELSSVKRRLLCAPQEWQCVA